MYQNPVIGLDKIRRSRKNVKNILSEFGLELCQELTERDLQDCEPEEDEIDDTEWSDLTVGFNGRRKKKWKYRTQTLCCSLCKYSARSWSTFHNHLKCYHPEDRTAAFLSACSVCPFIGHPRLVKKHFALFHDELAKSTTAGDSGLIPLTHSVTAEKYICRKCGCEDTLLYCMKKHVLCKHAMYLWQKHAGQRMEHNLGGQTKLYCRTCGMSAETTEHLVYHLLTSDKHKDIERHIESLILQKMKFRSSGATLQGASPLLALSANSVQPSVAAVATPSGQLLAGPQPGAVLQGLGGSGTLLRAQDASPQVLPAQAAALVQLASAEAKGLIRVDGPLSLPGAQALPVMSTPAGAPLAQQRTHQTQLGMVVGAHGQPALVALQRPVPGQGAPGSKAVAQKPPAAVATAPSATVPRPTVLTSQSLLSHLVPTGNQVNGMPTYTLAPLQMNMSGVQANKGPVVSGGAPHLVSQGGAAQSAQSPFGDPSKTKRWTSCQLCRELFPASVFEKHMETHKQRARNGLAAKAPFLKKMPDKTVKCQVCKVLLSEKSLFEHMKHGLMCLYCSGMFGSVKGLMWHIKTDHHLVEKVHSDFMRKEFRLHTNERGDLLFPHFDITTVAPKDMLGDQEVHLALVTMTHDLLFVKMSPNVEKPVCGAPGTVKTSLKHCPFCGEETLSAEDHRAHLRGKHFITPTIHAILKTPAYKCVFCGGVYTGKTTMTAVTVHLQRCKCAPKTRTDAERLMAVTKSNGVGEARKPQPLAPSNKKLAAAAPAKAAPAAGGEPESEMEVQRKARLEMAVKEAMMANKREREARAAQKKLDRDREKQSRVVTPPAASGAGPGPAGSGAGAGAGGAEIPIDKSVPLALNPAGMWKRSFEDRREFLTRYFHVKPYLTKKETAVLASALLLNNLDVACHFSNKRNRCVRAMQRTKCKVHLGFNMALLQTLKHNLYIPEQRVEPEQTEKSNSESDSDDDDDDEEEHKDKQRGAKQLKVMESDSEEDEGDSED